MSPEEVGQLIEQGELDAGLEAAQEAVRREPENAHAHVVLGRIHARRREFEDAQDELVLALFHDPDSAAAHYELGDLHWTRGESQQAVEHLRRAVELAPELAAAYSKLGFIYGRLQHFEAAIEVLERAATLDPNDVNALNRLGYALVRTEQYERGRDFFARVCESTPPANFGARLNLANALFHVGDFAAARSIYETVLATAPQHFETRWNLSHILLGERDFERGWAEYEQRWMVPQAWKQPRLIPYEPWTGQPLAGKTLLVSAEQGLGDEIMFASCIPELAARAGRVLLECEQRLAVLFRRSFPRVTVIGSERGAEVPGLEAAGAVDYHVPLGSLPFYLRRREADFPRHQGYLRADPARVLHWRERLATLGPGLKVGLSWRGGTADTRRALRTIAPEVLAPLLKSAGVRFVSLQYGDCRAEMEALRAASGVEIAHWQDAIDDYDETAALCAALDFTVSVCTSVIHLNGALGRPVWVLVPSVPEWRYAFHGDGLPWYPNARLFRQAQGETWAPVVARVANALASDQFRQCLTL